MKNLDEHNLTKDFLFSIKNMANGHIPVDSVPHLAHIEAVRFNRMKDSRRMHYSPKMKRFWHCLYKVAGGPPIRLISGPRGTGEKNFNTASANINFAVPSGSTLQQIGKTKHSSITPSIFHPVLETISTSVQDTPKEFILSFDGKSVGPGLKDQNEGDVDLWNFESNPNLNDEKEQLSNEEELVKKVRKNLNEENDSEIKKDLYKLLKIVTFWIKDVRQKIAECKETEIKYQKLDAQNPKYKMKHKYTIQNAQYLADNCRSVIQRCLKVNRDLCEKCSQLNKSSQFFIKNNPIDLAQQGNVRLLLPPDQLSDFFEDNDNTIYVKQ